MSHYDKTYHSTHVTNPGCFASDFSFTLYTPVGRDVQVCVLRGMVVEQQVAAGSAVEQQVAASVCVVGGLARRVDEHVRKARGPHGS